MKEEAPLGTAGGLYQFRKEIQEGLDEDSTVFILHGDIICTFPLVELLEFHKGHGKTCTMLTKRIPAATSKFGRIVVDESTHEILHYVEKPKTFVFQFNSFFFLNFCQFFLSSKSKISDLVNCGVYLFKMELFDKIATIAAKQPVETDIYDIFNDPKEFGFHFVSGFLILTYSEGKRILVCESSWSWMFFDTMLQKKHSTPLKQMATGSKSNYQS